MKTTILWILQLTVAVILFPAGFSKLASGAGDIQIFTALGMEPYGRYMIGIIECLSALAMLHPRQSAIGGLFATGVMCGALLAHSFVLGFDILGDGGKHILLLAVVIFCAATVTIVRRKNLPFIGRSL